MGRKHDLFPYQMRDTLKVNTDLLKSEIAPIGFFIEKELEKTVREIPFPPDFSNAILTFINSGGKRLRPIILICVCEALGGSRNDSIVPAIALELIHTASIIIDDIVDNHDFRRGNETIHKQFGEDFAMVLASTLISKAINMCSSNQQVLPIISNALLETSIGQAMDLRSRTNLIDEYIEIIRRKSASLFKSAAIIAALSTQGKNQQVVALGGFGEAFGIAFQIRDDLLDLIGDETILQKPIGSDLLEGKTTSVTLELSNLFGIPINQILTHQSKKKFQKIRNNALKAGVIDKINILCAQYVKEALSYLSILPDSESKLLLIKLTEYSSYRDR